MLDYSSMLARLVCFAAIGAASGVALGCPSTEHDPTGGSDGGSTVAATSTTGNDTRTDGLDSTRGDDVDDSTSVGSEAGLETSTSTGMDTGTTGAEACAVVLAEAVFDPDGDDDQLQWVKLKNTCSYDIDLSTWTIAYGGVHYGDNRQKQLDAPAATPDIPTIIPAFGCFVVGGPMSAVANGSPVYDLPEDFAPGLNYDVTVGSGIALFDAPADEVDETTVPLDAVIYGPNNDAGLIDQTGIAVPAPHVGLPPAGGSITRTGLEAQWDMNVAPQANSCPVF